MGKRTVPEILKFSVYLLFPVASLFLFNKPEVLRLMKTPAIDDIRDGFQREKEGLYHVPSSMMDIKAELVKYKEAKMRSQDKLANDNDTTI